MIKVSREEVLYIAQLSRIDIPEKEIEPMRASLQEILSYAARVQELAQEVEVMSGKNINVMREDTVISTDPEPLLASAPVAEDNFFVVPAVLEGDREGAL